MSMGLLTAHGDPYKFQFRGFNARSAEKENPQFAGTLILPAHSSSDVSHVIPLCKSHKYTFFSLSFLGKHCSWIKMTPHCLWLIITSQVKIWRKTRKSKAWCPLSSSNSPSALTSSMTPLRVNGDVSLSDEPCQNPCFTLMKHVSNFNAWCSGNIYTWIFYLISSRLNSHVDTSKIIL